jgi:hypothetical protein
LKRRRKEELKITYESVAHSVVLVVLKSVQKRSLRVRAERGLNLLQRYRIPSVGNVNFATRERQALQRLCSHSHSLAVFLYKTNLARRTTQFLNRVLALSNGFPHHVRVCQSSAPPLYTNARHKQIRDMERNPYDLCANPRSFLLQTPR